MVKRVLIIIATLFILALSIQFVSASCTEQWSCGSWSSCISGERFRECIDINNCGTALFKPAEIKDCDRYYYYFHDYCDRCDNGCEENDCESDCDYGCRDRYGYFEDKYVDALNQLEYQNYYNIQNQQKTELSPKIIVITPPQEDVRVNEKPSISLDSNFWMLILIVIASLIVLALIIIILIIALRK